MAVDLDLLSDEMAKAYRTLAAQSLHPGDFVKTFYDPNSMTWGQKVIKREDVEREVAPNHHLAVGDVVFCWRGDANGFGKDLYGTLIARVDNPATPDLWCVEFLGPDGQKQQRNLHANQLSFTHRPPKLAPEPMDEGEKSIYEAFATRVYQNSRLVQGLQSVPHTQQSVGALGLTSPFIASPGPPKPASSEPMINWEKLAGVYAAALAEANAKVRELEADLQRSTQAYAEVIAKLTAKPEQAPPTKSQQIAAALRFDPLPGSYAR